MLVVNSVPTVSRVRSTVGHQRRRSCGWFGSDTRQRGRAKPDSTGGIRTRACPSRVARTHADIREITLPREHRRTHEGGAVARTRSAETNPARTRA
jgi:hypothetical protein